MEIISVLEELVKIPSISGATKETRQVIAKVEELLSNIPSLLVTKGEINKTPYLRACTRKENKDMLWVVSHLDVVPAPAQLFELRQKGDKLLGRGVFDMKGVAAATITALSKLAKASDHNVGLLFTTDEEIGGKNGVGSIVGPDFLGSVALVLDQGDNFVLMEKMKGVLWVDISAFGTSAHGARPWLGDSAISLLVEYLHDFSTWFSQTIPQKDGNNYFTTMNIGTINGGTTPNQVSESAHATLDIRFVTDQDAQKILDYLKHHTVNKKISVTVKMHEQNVETDVHEHWYAETQRLINVLGITQGPGGEKLGHGSTDGRYFSPFGIPVITTRPPGGAQHSDKEWASKRGLEDLERLILALMELTKAS